MPAKILKIEKISLIVKTPSAKFDSDANTFNENNMKRIASSFFK